MSDRYATVRPGRAPLSTPTTPYPPTPVVTSSLAARRRRATRPDVRRSSPASSGWRWMSRRNSIRSLSSRSATASTARESIGPDVDADASDARPAPTTAAAAPPSTARRLMARCVFTMVPPVVGFAQILEPATGEHTAVSTPVDHGAGPIANTERDGVISVIRVNRGEHFGGQTRKGGCYLCRDTWEARLDCCRTHHAHEHPHGRSPVAPRCPVWPDGRARRTRRRGRRL